MELLRSQLHAKGRTRPDGTLTATGRARRDVARHPVDGWMDLQATTGGDGGWSSAQWLRVSRVCRCSGLCAGSSEKPGVVTVVCAKSRRATGRKGFWGRRREKKNAKDQPRRGAKQGPGWPGRRSGAWVAGSSPCLEGAWAADDHSLDDPPVAFRLRASPAGRAMARRYPIPAAPVPCQERGCPSATVCLPRSSSGSLGRPEQQTHLGTSSTVSIDFLFGSSKQSSQEQLEPVEICVERVSTNLSIGMLVIWQISFFFILRARQFPLAANKRQSGADAGPSPPTRHPHPDHHHLEHPSGPTAAILNIEIHTQYGNWKAPATQTGATIPGRLAPCGPRRQGGCDMVLRAASHSATNDEPRTMRRMQRTSGHGPALDTQPAPHPSSETEQSTRWDPGTHVNLQPQFRW